MVVATAPATAVDNGTPGVRGDEDANSVEGEEDTVFDGLHGVTGELPLLLLDAAVPPMVLEPDVEFELEAEMGPGPGPGRDEGLHAADCGKAS